MICLGYNNQQKCKQIKHYISQNDIRKIYVFCPEKMQSNLLINAEYVTYKNIIEYEYFYRLLQEIDQYTLLIIDECLRTQNRNDLTYNCLRHFINQAGHIIIFQYLPIIDSIEDFMILFDFDSKSQWKKEKFSVDIIKKTKIKTLQLNFYFVDYLIPASNNLLKKYNAEKNKIISSIGLKDPNTIPRNLYLITGAEKIKHLSPDNFYIGRNNRYKLSNLVTYHDEIQKRNYTIFEFPHNFIDFTDFLFFSQQLHFLVMTTNVKIDQWYFNRYLTWLNKLQDVYSKIQ
jgi:hypothetical protein